MDSPDSSTQLKGRRSKRKSVGELGVENKSRGSKRKSVGKLGFENKELRMRDDDDDLHSVIKDDDDDDAHGKAKVEAKKRRKGKKDEDKTELVEMKVEAKKRRRGKKDEDKSELVERDNDDDLYVDDPYDKRSEMLIRRRSKKYENKSQDNDDDLYPISKYDDDDAYGKLIETKVKAKKRRRGKKDESKVFEVDGKIYSIRGDILDHFNDFNNADAADAFDGMVSKGFNYMDYDEFPKQTNDADAAYDSDDGDGGMVPQDFDYKEYDEFLKSFHTNVGKSVGGTMGGLYRGRYGGILKVFIDGIRIEDKEEGTAFVIRKSQHSSILMTCSHIFCNLEPSQSIEVASSDFKFFKAEIGYRSVEMDVCLLVVREDLGASVLKLKTGCNKVSFGEDVYSISCPTFGMCVKETDPQPAFDKKLLNTLWFTMSRGCVCHPFLVGIHPLNLDGKYIQIQGGTWGPGGHGGPVFNLEGRVIGMYIGSTSDDSAMTHINHWALRLDSIRDFLERVEGVLKGSQGTSLKEETCLRKVVRSLKKCTKEIKKRRIRKFGMMKRGFGLNYTFKGLPKRDH